MHQERVLVGRLGYVPDRELDLGYPAHRPSESILGLVETGEIDIGTDTILHDFFDGTITIKTLSGTFSKEILNDYGPTAKVKKLIKNINDDTTVNAKIEDGKFVLTAGNQGDIIVLEETGEKPFFSGVKIPAFNTDKGNKIIDACPDCKNTRIILAVIKGYNNVDDNSTNYLDPGSPNFLIPAYTVDNFSYRKVLPSVELLNKLMIYHTFKNP